ncbi:MAG: pur operon repressor [Anaerovoracaceae bacterium]|jgi:purine operon repressor
MKRSGRIGSIIKILSSRPGRSFGLKYFCQLFGAAKSTVSEDIKIAKDILREGDLGRIETIPGAGGGVRYTSWISDEKCLRTQQKICDMLSDPSRIMGGGFLYTSDIMFDPVLTEEMAEILARKFKDCRADYVATIETKGLPLALMTGKLLDLPLIVVRREPKISEGPTISINYFSGSTSRMQKMSLSKKAAVPGSRALVVDDFMRAGGSMKGICELLSESDIEVCGIGVAMVAVEPVSKKIENYTPIIYLESLNEATGEIEVFPNQDLF